MDSIIARQKGEDFQAYFFWLQAAKLYQESTRVHAVEWESKTAATGFDDVVVHFSPYLIDGITKITRNCYQLKFHVNHIQGFTSDSLIDPDFIGTTKATILQRLQAAYQNDPTIADHTRLTLITNWGIDYKDSFAQLIRQDGRINLKLLSQGKTTKSIYRAIREKWKTHLNITSDEDLYAILAPLRIISGYNLTELKDHLSARLHLAGLQDIDGNKMIDKYSELVKRLHEFQITLVTKNPLLEICKREELVLPPPPLLADHRHTVGIRSFLRGTEHMEQEVNDFLCLLNRFSGRFINSNEEWKEVVIQIEGFIDKARNTGKHLELNLDTHLSVAFAVGRTLNPKLGVPVTIVQKSMGKKQHWTPEPQTLNNQPANLWTLAHEPFHTEGGDIVVAVGGSKDITLDVKTYAQKQLPDIAKYFSFTIATGPGHTAFRDANHVIESVQEIINTVTAEQTRLGKTGTVHLFVAGPVALAFFLGQYSQSLGKVVLYEFDMDKARSGSYEPAISLPL